MKQVLTATDKQNITFIKRTLLLIQAFIYGQTDAIEKLIIVIDKLVLKNQLEQLASKVGATAALQSKLNLLTEELTKYHFTLPTSPEKYISVLKQLSRLLRTLPGNPTSDDLRRSRMYFQSTIHKALLDDQDPNRSPDAAILLISMLIPHMIHDPVAKKASEYYREHPLDRGVTKEEYNEADKASKNPKKLSGIFYTPPRNISRTTQRIGPHHTVARAKNLTHSSHSSSAPKPALTVEEWQALRNNMKKHAKASRTTSTTLATQILSPNRSQQTSYSQSLTSTNNSSQFSTPRKIHLIPSDEELNSTIGRYRQHPKTETVAATQEEIQKLRTTLDKIEQATNLTGMATAIEPNTPTSQTHFIKGQNSFKQTELNPDMINELAEALTEFDFAEYFLSHRRKKVSENPEAPDTPYVWQKFKAVTEKEKTAENQESGNSDSQTRKAPKPLAYQLKKFY